MLTEEQFMEIEAAAQSDLHYLELVSRYKAEESHYERIMGSLPPEDREHLDLYIALCEEMEYRKTCLAYMLGKK